MDGVIGYLNTDLDLISPDDPTVLTAALKKGGVLPLASPTRGDDQQWYAVFETDERYSEPEPNIAAMLAVVETLDPPLRSAWEGCSQREFNIGYDCGREPWAFNQRLSVSLLGRMASAGASLRVTIYPDRQ